MAGRVGPRLDKGLSLPRVDRPLGGSKPGSYRSGRRRVDGPGGTTYPTVLEAYNRDSDYKRWRAGLDYWQGSGKSWADLERFYLVRPFRDFGAAPSAQIYSATYFPSGSSPEGAWTVVCRRRGAVILPQALQAADITIDTSLPQNGQHRLILDVSSTLSVDQVAAWRAFIGDQFEDSATSASYPQGLVEDPIDTIAYTLVDVDPQGQRLLFGLARPFMRRRPSPLRPRAFWQRVPYDPRAPLIWRNNGTRFLCSSHRLYCNCPDHSGAQIADLSTGAAGGAGFPRPSAGRTMEGRWEQQNASSAYSTRWRDLPRRADQRRECKHIHAVRWSLGYPFYEPSDYQIGADDRQFQGSSGGTLSSEQVIRYHQLRELTADRFAFALAASSGIEIDARDTIPADEEAPVRPNRRPILWTSTREPEGFRAQVDDWWVQRGTSVLRVYDPSVGRFVENRTTPAGTKPVIEELDSGDVLL